MIEFLKLYPWKDYDTKEKRGSYRFFSRPGEFIVFFRSEADQIAYDWWNSVPPLNYKDIIDKGRNLHNRIHSTDN